MPKIFTLNSVGGGGKYYLLVSAFLSAIVALCSGSAVDVVEVSAGEFHTCARFANGQLKCWGSGGDGQLGYAGVSTVGSVAGQMGDNLPFVDLGLGLSAVQVATGGRHTCALLNNSGVKCWGDSFKGQLGYGSTQDRGSFLGQMGDDLPFVDLGTNLLAEQIVAGTSHTCVLLNNARVKCWGDGSDGQLGYGDTQNRGDMPGQMGDSLDFVDLGQHGGSDLAVIQLTAAREQTCALLDNERVKCWGNSASGELGNGNRDNRGSAPGQMGNNLSFVDFGENRSAVLVACGPFNTCGVLLDGSVKCFGAGSLGALGNADVQDLGVLPGQMGEALPVVNLGENVTVLALSQGNFFTCALLDIGQIKCWGRGTDGSLGYGDDQSRGDDPFEMGEDLPLVDLGSNLTVRQISSGLFHTCARMSNNKVKCWGLGSSGVLGSGATETLGDGPGEMGDNLSFVDLGGSLPTLSPSPAPEEFLRLTDVIGLVGTGAAVGTGLLFTTLTFCSAGVSERLKTFDAVLAAMFVAAVTNAISGLVTFSANSLSFARTADLTLGAPVLLRCFVPVCVLAHIQYYKFLENHWNWKSNVVKLVVFNIEAIDIVFLMAAILNSLLLVELRVSDFELYAVTPIYVLLWLLQKVHLALVFKNRTDAPVSRSNALYRSISQCSLPLNVVLLIISILPLSMYLTATSVNRGKAKEEAQEKRQLRKESTAIEISNTPGAIATETPNTSGAIETEASPPTISRVELLAYYASLGVDIYLVVVLSEFVIGASAAGSPDTVRFINDISFAFAVCLIGLDIATLKSYFVIPETLESIDEEDGDLSKVYLIYVASTRVESYLLLCLIGVLAANLAEGGEDPLGFIFVVVDYLIVNLRVWLRLTSIAPVKAFDIDRIGRIEDFFPFNVVGYGMVAAVDVFWGLRHIPKIFEGSYKVFVYGRWLPKADLKRFLELLSTHGY